MSNDFDAIGIKEAKEMKDFHDRAAEMLVKYLKGVNP